MLVEAHLLYGHLQIYIFKCEICGHTLICFNSDMDGRQGESTELQSIALLK